MTTLSPTSIIPAAPNTTRGTPCRIGVDPKGTYVAYGAGNAVVFRYLDGTGKIEVAPHHQSAVTAVTIAQNGVMGASGDKDGKVSIWVASKANHLESFSSKPFGGSVSDIAFNEDGQRVLAVGDGKSSYGAVFASDAGNTFGSITGHSKPIVSGDFRKCRPYRVATGGSDATVCFFEGPPFKFHHSMTEHSGNVNAVRFSPDGSLLLTAGADKVIHIMDGKTGEKKGKIATGHTGGIYTLVFTQSGQVVTASADKTCRVFQVAADGSGGECVATSTFEPSLEFMQLGCAVAASANLTVSVGLNGDINILNEQGGEPKAVFRGHQRTIKSLHFNKATDQLLSCSSDGKALLWNNVADAVTVSSVPIKGLPGQNITTAALSSTTGAAYVIGGDDTIFRVNPDATVTELPKPAGCPQGSALLGDGTTLVLFTNSALLVATADNVSAPISAPYGPQSIAAHGTNVWVGARDNTIHTYTFDGTTLTETGVLSGRHGASVTAVAFNAQGTLCAAGDSNREIVIWDVATRVPRKEYDGMVFHTARVNCLAFAPVGDVLVSGSVDTSVIVWNLAKSNARLVAERAHAGGVSAVAFLSGTRFATGGSDASIQVWDIPSAWL
eukprot:PhM_4_TR18709/c0_g1_i1/m.7854